MFENETKAAILQRMLDASPADIDKRQGSVTWDLLSPAAIEFAQGYINADLVFNSSLPDTAYGERLDSTAIIFGIIRKPATKAVGFVTFTGPTNTAIPLGTRVSTGGATPIYFVTTAAVTLAGGSGGLNATGTVPAEAVQPGANGNVGIGAIRNTVGNLAGVVTVTNAANFVGGADMESDESLRERIYERARRPATSGNKAHFRQWALEVPGVSDAIVDPVWAGPGTVRVTALDDAKTAPDPAILQAIRDHIEEQRPVGADVTVVGATEVPIDISVKITLASGATVAEVEALILAGTVEYLRELAFVDPLVRYTRIAGIILAIPPVVDYADLLVNGGVNNVDIPVGSVAVVGTVTVTT